MVTTINDNVAGSLRQAITNANNSPGPNTITFQLSGSPPFSIKPLSALPSIGTPTFINATTQSGFAGTPVIELNGSLAGANAIGLQFLSGFSAVRGLAINHFSAQGISLAGPSNAIQGCFIGTDVTGRLAAGNTSFGIYIQSVSNLVGGVNAGDGNLISGGNDTGIYIKTGGTNIVQGNLIGVNITGTNQLKNINNGIVIDSCGGNLIGGGNGSLRNVISGNGQSGIYLNRNTASGNVIQGNYLGLGVTGSIVVSNAGDGITIYGAATNLIGGLNSGMGNVISGNGLAGISLNLTNAMSNTIWGNYIGTDATGQMALGNKNAGVVVSASIANQIGGPSVGAGNVISGNAQDGIFLTDSATFNVIQGNYIGLSAAGNSALANGYNGISLSGAISNTVGGTIVGARNVISGNTYNGVGILQLTDNGNTVLGNFIGTDVTGARAISNTLAGVRIQGRTNVIGGVIAGSGNVISGNGQQGIYFSGTNGNVSANMILGNIIGLDATGANALGNGDAGIGISGAAGNVIGGTSAGARNILSANAFEGLFIINAGSTNNVVQGNYLGTDSSGYAGRGNLYEGITLQSTAGNQIGGSTAGAGNLISANNNRGVYLSAASANVFQGNLIGTKADGISALGNINHGIDIDAGSTNNIIGGTGSGAGNILAFAQTIYAGVRVRASAYNNLISGNSIFSNGALGIDLGNNGVDSIVGCESGVAATAANVGQNYPVLTNAYSGNRTVIKGTLNSLIGKTYRLEFFASPVGDSSGNGEGQLFLGQSTLTLGTACSSNFSVSLPVSVPANWVVTATATNPTNNTSEFSAWIPVASVPSPQVLRSSGGRISLFWTNTGGSFQVQQTVSLLPASWTTVAANPYLTNGFVQLDLPITNATDFYRLVVQ